MEDLKHSPLHEEHLKLDARMAPFGGWEMPIQYAGILPEHKAVRESAGVFDISHMGQILVTNARSRGNRVGPWLNRLLTNNIEKLALNEGQYTLLLNANGGVIDDLIVYRTAADDFLLVVNAARISEVDEWMRKHLEDSQIEMVNISATCGGLAVQGPSAETIYAAITDETSQLPPRFHIAKVETDEGTVFICRTGYTGEDGFELFCPVQTTGMWWKKVLDAAVTPCGLGARDSLRLEKCYPLNGSDLSMERTPLEAGLNFCVDLTKRFFIGQDALLEQKKNGIPERLAALRMTGKSPPPRHGYAVLDGEQQIGELTSGGLSPGLGVGIGMAYLPSGKHLAGTELSIEIRGKRHSAVVVKKPFL